MSQRRRDIVDALLGALGGSATGLAVVAALMFIISITAGAFSPAKTNRCPMGSAPCEYVRR